MPLLSIVVPAYNEAANLEVFYRRLCDVLGAGDIDWEWIVVDDHSSDATYGVAAGLATTDPRVRAFRLARNSGSHTAILCGLHQARGDAAVVLAADLQDPPETVPRLLAEWRQGAQVVWAVRGRREGETRRTIALSRLYYFLMRRLVGIKDMPATGADFMLIDHTVVDALRQFNESNISIMALITWMGFRQTSVTYDKQARLHGRSGWSLEKKLKLAVDSITAFTYKPLRWMSYVGAVTALLGFAYAAVAAGVALFGGSPRGWSSLMVVILVIGGIQMLMMGVLGEYLWRALDEARRRPLYLVEATTDAAPDASPRV